MAYRVKYVTEVDYRNMDDEQLADVYRLSDLKAEWECTCFDEVYDYYVCLKDVNDTTDDRRYAVYLKSTGNLLCLVADSGIALEGYADSEYGVERNELYRQIAILAGWPENMNELQHRITWRELLSEIRDMPEKFLDTTAYVWDSHRESLEPVTGLKPWEFFLDGSIPGPDVDDNCFYIDTPEYKE